MVQCMVEVTHKILLLLISAPRLHLFKPEPRQSTHPQFLTLDIKEFACAEGELQGIFERSEMMVDFGSQQSSPFLVGEIFVFIQHLVTERVVGIQD